MGRGLNFGCASISSSVVLSSPVVRSLVIVLCGDPSVSSDEYCQEEANDK
jgi:hypothetical protein